MSTLKFKSKIEVPGIHLKGKDKNGSDIGTQVRVNSISLYADADCEQLNMSASRILLENEIDGIHTTKIAPDLIELTSEDLETGQETTTSITSTGIATNNITRQNTNKSITIGSTSSTPVDIKYLNTNQVKTGAAIINSVYNIHTNQYSELVATDMQTNTDTLIIPRYTNTIRHPVLRYDTITANQLQIIKQEIV